MQSTVPASTQVEYQPTNRQVKNKYKQTKSCGHMHKQTLKMSNKQFNFELRLSHCKIDDEYDVRCG